MDKLRGMSQTELQAMLANEDKINEFVLQSPNIQHLQQQRDLGRFFYYCNMIGGKPATNENGLFSVVWFLGIETIKVCQTNRDLANENLKFQPILDEEKTKLSGLYSQLQTAENAYQEAKNRYDSMKGTNVTMTH